MVNISLWVTPLWFLSLGISLGAAALALIWGVLWLVRRELAVDALHLVRDSVLSSIGYVVLAFVALFLLAAPFVETGRILESTRRIWSVGEQTKSVTLEPGAEDVPLAVSFRSEELVSFSIQSDRDVVIAAEEGAAYESPIAVVQGDEPYEWKINSNLARGFESDVTQVFLTNESDAPANVKLVFTTDVRVPEVHHLPITAALVVGLFLAFFLVHRLAPQISNIAIATAKEATGQPLFLLFLLGGGAALFIYIILPYNTFGEDVKMLTDSGLTTIMALSIIFAIWTASVSVAKEIEGKTALTLLSKPISRFQFILGKFVGIVSSTLIIFAVLGAILLATISYKVVYDARETSNPTPEWQDCYETMMRAPPGLALALFETATLAAVSVAISTRLPMLPNLLICGTIYVLGNLTPLMAQSSVGDNPFVRFTAQGIAVVLPVLDHFNIQPAIAAGQPVPIFYLGWAALYCLIYCAFAMLLALIFFEDRDLA